MIQTSRSAPVYDHSNLATQCFFAMTGQVKGVVQPAQAKGRLLSATIDRIGLDEYSGGARCAT